MYFPLIGGGGGGRKFKSKVLHNNPEEMLHLVGLYSELCFAPTHCSGFLHLASLGNYSTYLSPQGVHTYNTVLHALNFKSH